MTTPSTPRKRQNLTSQSTITSFFTPSSRSTTTAAAAVPELPTPIKSSLLTVGMRVRKSVPEGYKSGTYKFNTFPVTKSNGNNTLAKPPKSLVTIVTGSPSKKREFAEETEGKENAPVEVVRGEIAMPKSLRRRFHAAIGRKEAEGDVVMGERGEEFEEAEFLVRGSD